MPSFTPVKKADLVGQREATIITAANDCGLATSLAANLLPRYDWDPKALLQAWFNGDREQILKQARLKMVEADTIAPVEGDACMMYASEQCTEFSEDPWTLDDLTKLPCGHVACNACWAAQFESKIGEADVLGLRCIFCMMEKDATGGVAYPESLIKRLVTPELFGRYQKFVAEGFVKAQPKVAWCPAADCEFVVDGTASARLEPKGRCVEPGCQRPADNERDQKCRKHGIGTECLAVNCACGHGFCFHCLMPAHAPVTCEHVRDWEKNTDEGGNATALWLEGNSKPCPDCGNAIEKTDGCNHMKCGSGSPYDDSSTKGGCGYHFCWECLEPMNISARKLGVPDHTDFFNCNKKAKELDLKKLAKKDKEQASFHMYLVQWKAWKSQQDDKNGIIKMKDKIDAKCRVIETDSRDSNALSIIDKMGDAFERILSCRDALMWCEVQLFYFEHESAEYSLFETRLVSLKKIVHHLTDELMKPPLEISLHELSDNLAVAEKTFSQF